MRLVLSILARILPPAVVLFLFVDTLVNPLIPRLGTVSASAGKLTVEESRALLDQSRKLLLAGKDQQALGPALKLFSVYPENYLYSKTLAEIYQRLGRYKEESEYWERFMQNAPLPLEGCPDIGQAYWNQKLYDKAVAAFERCLSFDPEMSDSTFFLAHALEMTGNRARASQLYQQALARDPQNMDCRIGLARVEMREGRLADAKKRIVDALHDSPENLDALLTAGLIFWRLDDVAQAKRYLTKGAGLSTGYADYHLILGRIEESEGHVSDALMRYNRVLEIQPDNQEAAQRRAALSRKRR
jgi:tetratricopeptide (TPR) repeat protein